MAQINTINEMWMNTIRTYGNSTALGVRHSESVKTDSGKITEESFFKEYTYIDVENEVQAVGAGLASIGLHEQEAVAVISENCMEWLIADLAVQGNRAYNVPRGVTSTQDELLYILKHSEARIIFIQEVSQLDEMKKIRSTLEHLETIIVLDRTFTPAENELAVFSIQQLIDRKEEKEMQLLFRDRRNSSVPEDIATLIYTSGTTGTPKGIPLTQSNLMHNIRAIPPLGNFNSEDRFLSILPIWHIFEREFEYIELSVGASIWYTSKLTLLKDLQEVQPTYMASVPRIWLSVYNGVMKSLKTKGKLELFEKLFVHSKSVINENRYKEDRQYRMIGESLRPEKASFNDKLLHKVADLLIYSKIRAKVGSAFKAGISGGGSLPGYIDDFFEAIGVSLLEGYGLTETAPILTARSFAHLIPYTAGQPLQETLVQIRGEDGSVITDSSKGIIWVSGPQVMSGYYKNEEETAKVISVDSEGRSWFNTGDIGRITATGDISIIGRNKDTIVLLGGENIEPEPIERQLLSSDYLDQVMICGQDQEYLTLLLVPNIDALYDLCQSKEIDFDPKNPGAAFNDDRIMQFFDEEIAGIVNEEKGFKELESIHAFRCTKEFSPEDNTLTLTFKVKRFNVQVRDHDLIKSMYPHYNESRSE